MVEKLKRYALKIYIKKSEKNYKHLKYIFIPSHSSKKLVVVFSGFSGGRNAQYNYVRTLGNINANRLYLLDDYGFKDNPGTYYLGENKDFFLVNDIKDLINKLCKENDIDSIITAGSSKGGTSAILYGLMLNADYIVAGAPQYYIGRYLNSNNHIRILEKIMGDTTSESISELDSLLQKQIEKSSGGKLKKIFLHYSPYEHTYMEHIQHMIEDLRINGFSVAEDNEYIYSSHSDVAKFFPSYLKSTVCNLTK